MKLGGKRDWGFTMIELLTVIAIIAILAGILIPNFLRVRGTSQLTACKSNLKNMATAIEMYSAENAAKFPPGLALVTPNYMRAVPTCPAVGINTYSASFTSTINPPFFMIQCEGANHTSVDTNANFPQWSSADGLLEQ